MPNEKVKESSGDNHDEDVLFSEFITMLESKPDYVPPTLTRKSIRFCERNKEHFTLSEYRGLLQEFHNLEKQPDRLRRPRPIRDAAKCLLSKPENLAEAALLLWLAALLLLVVNCISRTVNDKSEIPMTLTGWQT